MTRRTISFADFDQVAADLDQLLQRGYRPAGKWSLAENADHLRTWMSYNIDGYPAMPLLKRPFFFVVRKTLGPSILRSVISSGKMPTGGPMPISIPVTTVDDVKAVDAFKQTMVRFRDHTGPIHPSPLFGPLTREQVSQLQLVHCAHHLSFLVPK